MAKNTSNYYSHPTTLAVITALVLPIVGMPLNVFAADVPAKAATTRTAARTAADAVSQKVKDPKRHEEFLFRITEGDIGLLFMGDSIIDHWPRTGEFTWLKYATYHVADFGIGGDRTEHVLWRINHGELDNIHPKVVVLMIGTNNIGNSPTDKPEWAAAGVKLIVEQVHQKLPTTKVLLLGVFPRGNKDSRQRADTIKINEIISKLGNDSNTRYLDIGNVFLDEAGEIAPDIMPDKLHPTAKGYERWYKAMQPLLDEMMK